jgi:hypothetical protein
MDYMKMGVLGEGDFHGMVERAGGRRFSADDSREVQPNADYLFPGALVELKIVEEDGLTKENRQRKIAEIFRARQPDRPVIILGPELLDATGQRAYYNIMAGPIKTAVKKAAKQLEESRTRVGDDPVRVLVLINNGYAALSHEEFKEIAFKCVCHDTQKIDCLIAGGLYYYGDRFDHYFFPLLDICPVNASRPFASYENLRKEWLAFGEQLATAAIFGNVERTTTKLPVVDLTYDLDGITYVKLAPKMGKPSKFWVRGRPREDSTGIEAWPPVAETFPRLDAENWRHFKDRLPASDFFKATYSEWIRFRDEQEADLGKAEMPFVPVDVAFEDCVLWCKEHSRLMDSQTVCDYANELFDRKAHHLIKEAADRLKSKVVVPEYVLVVTEEIGQDKANDLSSIFRVQETIAGRHESELVRNARLVHMRALALACAYAVKLGIGTVLYERDQTNAWI